MEDLKNKIWMKLSAEVRKNGQFQFKSKDVCRENISRININSEDMTINALSTIKFNGTCELKVFNEDGSFKETPLYFNGEAQYEGVTITLHNPIMITLR